MGSHYFCTFSHLVILFPSRHFVTFNCCECQHSPGFASSILTLDCPATGWLPSYIFGLWTYKYKYKTNTKRNAKTNTKKDRAERSNICAVYWQVVRPDCKLAPNWTATTSDIATTATTITTTTTTTSSTTTTARAPTAVTTTRSCCCYQL